MGCSEHSDPACGTCGKPRKPDRILCDECRLVNLRAQMVLGMMSYPEAFLALERARRG